MEFVSTTATDIGDARAESSLLPFFLGQRTFERKTYETQRNLAA
jgi:hypothetical protein